MPEAISTSASSPQAAKSSPQGAINAAPVSGSVEPPALTILYDGGCPLCLREVRFLQRREAALPGPGRLAFVDIDDPTYDAACHAGIGYREAMGRIHAIDAGGAVLRDVAVFRRAYDLIGLGWLYAPSRWPLLRQAADALYRLWAAARLRLTGRPDLEELCRQRAGAGGEARCRI